MADITVPTPDLTDSGRSIPGGEGFIEPGQLHDSKYHFEASLLIIRKSDHYGDKTLWSPLRGEVKFHLTNSGKEWSVPMKDPCQAA